MKPQQSAQNKKKGSGELSEQGKVAERGKEILKEASQKYDPRQQQEKSAARKKEGPTGSRGEANTRDDLGAQGQEKLKQAKRDEPKEQSAQGLG